MVLECNHQVHISCIRENAHTNKKILTKFTCFTCKQPSQIGQAILDAELTEHRALRLLAEKNTNELEQSKRIDEMAQALERGANVLSNSEMRWQRQQLSLYNVKHKKARGSKKQRQALKNKQLGISQAYSDDDSSSNDSNQSKKSRKDKKNKKKKDKRRKAKKEKEERLAKLKKEKAKQKAKEAAKKQTANNTKTKPKALSYRDSLLLSAKKRAKEWNQAVVLINGTPYNRKSYEGHIKQCDKEDHHDCDIEKMETEEDTD